MLHLGPDFGLSQSLQEDTRVTSSRIGMALAVAAIAMTGIAVRIAADEPATTEMTLQQEPPELVLLDHGVEGASHGDFMFFDSSIRSEDGSLSGIMTGTLLVANMHPPGDVADQEVQSRFANVVIDVADKGTIVIMGSATYPADSAAEMEMNAAQVRAIVGGTGEYIGARGEAATTRNEDGSYTHQLTLLND